MADSGHRIGIEKRARVVTWLLHYYLPVLLSAGRRFQRILPSSPPLQAITLYQMSILEEEVSETERLALCIDFVASLGSFSASMLVAVALDGVLVGVGVVVWFRNIEREVDC